ncbi:MAG TPA: sigma-70 family RNA polymerase sigma factor [Ilumatobacter sp.]|nr:sigma-70 family RNA polymerase sigma factor [Ilumatobacter sp.]
MSDHALTTDAELVASYLSGDRAAFAAIYDRYGNGLYDVAAAMLRNRHDAADVTQDTFVVAAERMAQLRDPSRLKPWLLAILRNEVYRRTGKRARQVPTDFTALDSRGFAAEMALPPTYADEASAAEYEELAALVRDAAAGLDPRDQLVLELAVRQGLEGDDLASALGVSAQQSYSLVHRMRQRTERSLGAFCVARRGRPDCAELDRILAGWDGRFSVLIRKRVARHIDDCDICEHNRRKFVPLMLFGSAPAFAAPPDLRDRVLGAVDAGSYGLTSTATAARPYEFTAPGGFPTAMRYSRRLVLWWLMGAAALMLLIGGGVFVLAGDRDDPLQLAIDVPPAAGTTTTTTGPATTTTIATTTTTTGPTTTALLVVPPSASTTPSTVPDSSTTTTTAPRKTTTTTVAVTTTTEVALTTTTQAVTTTQAPTTTLAPTTTQQTTTVPVPTGSLGLSNGSLDFGTSATSLTVQLVNEGAGPAAWNASVGPAFAGGTPFNVSPASGNLPSGAVQTLTVTINRNGLAPGSSHSAAIRFNATGTTAVLTVHGAVEGDATPPTVRISEFAHDPCRAVVTVQVEANDPETGIASYAGQVTWGSSSATLAFNGSVGNALIAAPPVGTTVPPLNASVTVTNGDGLTSTTTASRTPAFCADVP